jgi:hypothetical protein
VLFSAPSRKTPCAPKSSKRSWQRRAFERVPATSKTGKFPTSDFSLNAFSPPVLGTNLARLKIEKSVIVQAVKATQSRIHMESFFGGIGGQQIFCFDWL